MLLICPCVCEFRGFYRATKLDEAKDYCDKGLNQNPYNEELKKLKKKINSQILEQKQRKAQVSKSLTVAKVLNVA